MKTLPSRHSFLSHLALITAMGAIMAAPAIAHEDEADKDAEEEKEADLSLEGKTTELKMTLNEGTWLSLDVTGDDSEIVFELLGDLYKLPIGGGAAEQLTSGLGYDSQPSLSPDGKMIAFISDRDGDDNLWVANADGSNPRKISKVSRTRIVSPTWIPDGSFILVTEIGKEPQLSLYHRNGGSGVSLQKMEDGEAEAINGVGASYSPDGQYVYYAAPTGDAYPAAQIHRLDLSTGAVAPLTQLAGGAMRPKVSPDGRYLAYITRDESVTRMRLRDLLSGADRQLATGLQRDAQEQGRAPSRDFFPAYDFTSDSGRIIFFHEGAFASIDVASGEIEPISFKADVTLDIGPDLTNPYRVDDGPVRARIIHDPKLSPVGNTIASSILGRIYLANATGEASPKALTAEGVTAFVPTWSPDGQHIAYVTWSDIGGGHIWRMPVDGSAPAQKLTEHPAYYTDLDWSPDGGTIVGMRGSEWIRHRTFSEFGGLDTPMEFISLPASGGEVSVLRPAAEGEREPHFAGTSDRVFAYSGEALISMTLDGRDPRTHLKVKGATRNARQQNNWAQLIRVRPDGKWAVALVNGQVWVVPIPALGASTPEISVRSPSLPAARLTDIGADFIGWSDDGTHVTWAIGSTFYSRPFDEIEFDPIDPDDLEPEPVVIDPDAEEPVEEEDEHGHSHGRSLAQPVLSEGFGDWPTFPTKRQEVAAKSAEDATDADDENEPLPEEHESVAAQKISVTVPRAMPTGAILLTGATVIDMAGETTAEMAEGMSDADILVVDNRIKAIGAKGSLTTPDGAEVIDVAGKFIIPGLVDTHAHWEFRTQDVLEPHNWSLVANIAYGVTSGLDVQTAHKDYFTYRDFIDAGMSVGQRAFMTGPGVFSNTDFESYERAHAYLRRYSDHYETYNIKSYLAGSRKQRQWVVRASQDLGLMPTTEGGSDMRMDITHAIDGMHGNEHNLPIFPLQDDVLKLYAETKTAYTATLLVQYHAISAINYFFSNENPHDDEKLARFYPENRIDVLTRRRRSWAIEEEYAFKGAAEAVAELQRAGGLVGIGGHGELQGLGYHWEMQAHEAGGMTPAEILRAATIDGAKIIGVSTDLGSLEAGKLADLVVLNKDPRETIKNATDIEYVMINGAMYEDETLTQVWPEEKPLAPFWWSESSD